MIPLQMMRLGVIPEGRRFVLAGHDGHGPQGFRDLLELMSLEDEEVQETSLEVLQLGQVRRALSVGAWNCCEGFQRGQIGG